MHHPLLKVTHIYREPRNTGVSIEGIFQTVRKDLEGKVSVTDFYCDPSLSRIGNTKKVSKYAGDINHITGDVNFLAIGLRGHKNILTVHDLGYYENPVHSRLKHLLYHTFWFRIPLMYVDIVTVVSVFTKEKLMRYFHYPEERIRVIPDPVKPVFRAAPRPPLRERPVVLMLGTGKHKNLDGLIKAASDGSMHLDIVGWPSPDEIATLKEYNIPHTISNGLTDEQVWEHYANCDILFIASHYEGFGMPIIEAQAVGRPVVTSNKGAMLEIGKDSTLLVDPDSPEQIRNAINALAGDNALYEATVAKGRINAARYDHRIISEQYLELYNELYNK